MISDTQMRYGSLVVRHGRSRFCAAYHASSALRIDGSASFSIAPGTAPSAAAVIARRRQVMHRQQIAAASLVLFLFLLLLLIGTRVFLHILRRLRLLPHRQRAQR